MIDDSDELYDDDDVPVNENANDYIFAFSDDIWYILEASYWNKHGYLNDNTPQPYFLENAGFFEINESSMYEAMFTESHGRKNLTAMGLTYSQPLETFVR